MPLLIMACSGSTPAISRVEGVQRRDSGGGHHVILHPHVLCTAVRALLGQPGRIQACREGCFAGLHSLFDCMSSCVCIASNCLV